MATTFRGSQIVSNFKRELEDQFKLSVKFTSISRQVFELEGATKCLLYVKARSAHPIRWGVTANVINRLKDQKLPWAVILLFLSHESGYLLLPDDVEYYIKNVWPLGSDGDYKPSEGNYLSRNNPFNSMASLMEEMKRI
jgi:hypothetical protein